MLTESNFYSYMKSNEKVLVDFYDRQSKNEQALQLAFRKARTLGCSARFAMVDADSQLTLANKFVPVGGFPQLLWFLHGEATQYHRTIREPEAIVDFVMAVDRDPIIEVDNEERTKDYNRAIVVKAAKSSSLYKAAQTVASKHMDTMAFVLLTSWTGADALVAKQRQSFDAMQSPDVTFEGQHTVDAIDDWVKSLVIKSEKVPEFDSGDAKLIVASNFEENVLKPGMDVFLLVFAPWCGFSKKAMPAWEELARKLGPVQHLDVLKMDGSANDSPLPDMFSWRAFPTIYFMKAGSRVPMMYKGPRNVDSYVDFARQHGSKPIVFGDAAGPAADEDTDL